MTSQGIKDGAPVLLVADVEAAANYYRDQLGFRYDQLWGDPPGFCILWRGPVGSSPATVACAKATASPAASESGAPASTARTASGATPGATANTEGAKLAL